MKWFRLFDKVFSEKNLWVAFQQVARKKGAAGVDHVTVDDFERRLPDSVWELSDQLKAGTYRPQAVRRVNIPKPGSNETRPLGIPTVRDRTVQAAVVNVIEPIFEIDFAERSYGFRPGRGCKDALRRVDPRIKAGYVHTVDADLKSSLDPLDHLVANSGFEMVRYADDFVILCRTGEDAQRALELVRNWVAENELTLHPTKTKIVDSRTEGFSFLGDTFKRHSRVPREKSLKKLKEVLRQKTRRNSGDSMVFIVNHLNETLRGWFAYFQHIRPPGIFRDLDSWLRMRLRSILRKRVGGRGRGHGFDNSRWPNRYFADLGLFSLAAARVKVVQSSRR